MFNTIGSKKYANNEETNPNAMLNIEEEYNCQKQLIESTLKKRKKIRIKKKNTFNIQTK